VAKIKAADPWNAAFRRSETGMYLRLLALFAVLLLTACEEAKRDYPTGRPPAPSYNSQGRNAGGP